jgi:hypothetical protein
VAAMRTPLAAFAALFAKLLAAPASPYWGYPGSADRSRHR